MKILIAKWLIILGVIGAAFLIVTTLIYAKYVKSMYTETFDAIRKVGIKETTVKKSEIKKTDKEKKNIFIIYIKVTKNQVTIAGYERNLEIQPNTAEVEIVRLTNEYMNNLKKCEYVFIDVDKDAKWELLEQLMQICKKRGFKYALRKKHHESNE